MCPTLKVSDVVDLGWDFRVCFLNSSSGLQISLVFAYSAALYYFRIVLIISFEFLIFNHNFLIEAKGFKPCSIYCIY